MLATLKANQAYLLNYVELAVIVEVKDLGVTVDSSLNFDVHVRQTVATWRELL